MLNQTIRGFANDCSISTLFGCLVKIGLKGSFKCLIKQSEVWGRIAQWKANLLPTQRPRVRKPVNPIFFRENLKFGEINLAALLRVVKRGLMMLAKPN